MSTLETVRNRSSYRFLRGLIEAVTIINGIGLFVYAVALGRILPLRGTGINPDVVVIVTVLVGAVIIFASRHTALVLIDIADVSLKLFEQVTNPATKPSKFSDSPTNTTSSSFYVSHGAEVQGPFAESQLRQLFQQGTLTGDTLILREGSQDWQPLSSISGDRKP